MHRGRSFADVARNEPGYAAWAMQTEGVASQQGLREFARFLREEWAEAGAGSG